MKLKALSHYENDKSTRYGDCILGYNETELMVYDCGHERHAEEVMKFLHNSRIDAVKIIISHNDADHIRHRVFILRNG